MNISELKDGVMLCRKIGVTPFLWGHKGLGKSSLVEQLATKSGFGCVNLRCSQLEASDLRGPMIADEKRGVSRCLPPEELPRVPSASERKKMSKEEIFRAENGFLFLDELNRAEDDVIQAVFQLVLDGRVGGYVLPEGWSVVVAGNYSQGYLVNGFNDDAFIDRFCHLELSVGDSYFREWSDYMSGFGGASSVLQYVGSNLGNLSSTGSADLGFVVQPSPRSWEFVARAESFRSEFSEDVYREVLSGIIGVEQANGFLNFSCRIHPKDVLRDGVKAIEKVEAKKKLSRNEVVGLAFGLSSLVRSREKVSNKEEDNVIEFVHFLCSSSERDMAVSFAQDLVGRKRNLSAALSNPRFAELLAKHNVGADNRWLKRFQDDADLAQLMSLTAWGKDD